MPFSAYIIIKRGQRARANWLIWVALFMFTLSTSFWAASVVNLFLRFHAYFVNPSTFLANRIDAYTTLANAVILVNVGRRTALLSPLIISIVCASGRSRRLESLGAMSRG